MLYPSEVLHSPLQNLHSLLMLYKLQFLGSDKIERALFQLDGML